MRKLLKWRIWAGLSIAVCVWVLYALNKPVDDWREGELVVILPDDKQSISAAFELELATLFAKHLNVRLVPHHLPPEQIFTKLSAHRAHFAAGGIRKGSQPNLRYGDSYQVLKEQVVCNDKRPRQLSDLRMRTLTIVAGQESARKPPSKIPSCTGRPVATITTLVGKAAEGLLDCTVANEEQIATAKTSTPNWQSTRSAPPSHLAWAFPFDDRDRLIERSREFFTQIRQDGTLSRLIDLHYGHNERLESLDAAAFITQTQTLLPRYRALFEEAEALTGIEWQLIAALAYQESHWNPLATSYTNVRGMMMLTEDTADRMRVNNRLDARESVLAGARYLQLLRDQLPPRISDKDRTWLALAAYNQGMGHLEDARVLTARSGLNPDSWTDVKKIMPLLSRPEYFEQLKHGAARGGEAVILTETVHQYYDMLKRLEPPATKPLKKPYFGLVEKARNKFKLH
jgi:membrane-bound lytic murein transglycosylase F